MRYIKQLYHTDTIIIQEVIIFTKKKTISRDTPLAELTLRKYEKPYNLSKRELIRKLCLSIGLLQPGDSRDIIVDVLMSLITSEKELSSEEVRDIAIALRKQHNLPVFGVASSNIRRQLKRLRDLFLIEKVRNNYRITEKSTLHNIYQEKIERYYLDSIKSRVSDYFKIIDEQFANIDKQK